MSENPGQVNYSKNWDPKEKELYTKILTNISEVTKEIFNVVGDEPIINSETEAEIKKYSESCGIYYNKLVKNTFEIAIVGLEKAGKSSFGNALIKADVLPSKSERCTFTSTQLEYSIEDEAVVEFYSKIEFNELFAGMLKAVEYPEAEKISFESLTIDQIEDYFVKLQNSNPNVYKIHTGRTEEDIKDIIKGKDKIARLLDRPVMIFNKEHLKTTDFTKFIIDPTLSRAVKKVRIKSSQLKEMENCIIYDVPGFDSPTKIHEDQTLERLREADAIILVTNVGRNPNLRGTELQILLRNCDADGIQLKDKLFIYGNQIDTVNNIEDARKNAKVLQLDAAKYDIAKKGRIVIGSALAYLQENKISPAEECLNKLKSLGLQNGIENLKKSLIDYYKNDRFEILKTRINKNIGSLKCLFEAIILENTKEFSEKVAESHDNMLYGNLIKNIKKLIESKLSNLKDNIKNEILSTKYFTENLKKLIESEFNPISIKDIEKERIKVTKSNTIDFPAGRVNIAIRENLHQSFRDKFTKMIVKIAGEKIMEIDSNILAEFMSAYEVHEGNPNYEEIKNATKNELINALVAENVFDEKSFIHLIERFSRCLFDILILYPLTSSDRYNKFVCSEHSFYGLALYDDRTSLSTPLYAQPFINIILAHLESEKGAAQKIEMTKDNYIRAIRANLKDPSAAEDILVEVNKDINYLVDILKSTVLKAINLEEPFLSTLTNQIDSLINGLDNATIKVKANEEHDLYLWFIDKYYAKMRPDIFARNAMLKATCEHRQKIVVQLKAVLNKMNAAEIYQTSVNEEDISEETMENTQPRSMSANQ